MEITEVRIKLMEDTDDRLQGFCSVTFDDCFVVRDLKIIEGVGPKLESILKEAGITDLKVLSESSVESLQKILEGAGNRYKMFNPSTWPKQAKMAVDGLWEELKEYQDRLDGGVEK